MSLVYSCSAPTVLRCLKKKGGWAPFHKSWEGIAYRLGMKWMNSCYLDGDQTQNKSPANKQDAGDSKTVIVPWMKRSSWFSRYKMKPWQSLSSNLHVFFKTASWVLCLDRASRLQTWRRPYGMPLVFSVGCRLFKLFKRGQRSFFWVFFQPE